MNNESQIRLQRLLAILSLGVCDALRNESISHDEAEQLLFSPHTLHQCERIGAGPALVSLIHKGAELDAVSRLVGPAEWRAELERIRENALAVLSSTPTSDSQLPKWTESLLDDE